MKLFALHSEKGEPIASTCLCENHLDKKGIVQPPLNATTVWVALLPLNTFKCIWCGADDNTAGVLPGKVHTVDEVLDSLDKFTGNATTSLHPLDQVKVAHDALSDQLEDPEAQPHITHDLAVRLCLALNAYYETL
jgi:hypothetical protein